MNNQNKLNIFLRPFLLLAICGVVGIICFVTMFYSNAVRESVVIELSDKDLAEYGGGHMIDSLVMPYVRHKKAFRIYANRLNLWDRVKHGRYELNRGMDVVELVRMFKLGMQSPLNVIFNNARGVGYLAGHVGNQIEADSTSLHKCIVSAEMAEMVGVKREEMLAIFIPNTYQLWWTISPESFVARMKTEYERFWTEEREAKRKALGLSRVEVSTLASIVYEESAKVDEMPRIAGVYMNRLRRGIKLQADPTVRFAIGDFSITRVLHKHLTYNSPYNTYLHKGLPPGPIAIPSIAAIESVLNYEKHNYIYFCARPSMDGYHNFTVSYSTHLANAKAYAAALDKINTSRR